MKRLAGYLLVAVLTIALVVGIDLLTRAPAPSGAEPPPRLDLRPSSLVGCYELDVEPWNVARDVRTPDGGRVDAAEEPATGGRDADRVAMPAPLTPPERVMLLPDSADAYARSSATSRAVPVPEDEDHPERALRWFTRADTLWVLWSEHGVRAGVALFEEGDRLVGSARALSDSIDASARATAWRINCATFMREAAPGFDRR